MTQFLRLANGISRNLLRFIRLAVVFAGIGATYLLLAQGRAESAQTQYRSWMKSLGWSQEYDRGTAIVRKLASLNGKDLAKLDDASYRGQKVAFVGGGAFMNDLTTEGGVYIRVLIDSNKDLRPQAVWWGVLVRGEVVQVLPENKMIVIKVDEKDWQLHATG